jgi:predicted RNA polymerase sigma factor
VSATRASVESTGWRAEVHQRKTEELHRDAELHEPNDDDLAAAADDPFDDDLLRLIFTACRSRSMPRCLAVAMSHAPGLSGTPASGHCSSAATSAS